MKKRLLAMLMAVAMMLSLLPTAAFAATDPLKPADKTAESGKITLHKQATRTGPTTWDVDLSVKTGEISIQQQPLEVVFVLDRSGSMAWCTTKEKHTSHTVDCYNQSVECTRESNSEHWKKYPNKNAYYHIYNGNCIELDGKYYLTLEDITCGGFHYHNAYSYGGVACDAVNDEAPDSTEWSRLKQAIDAINDASTELKAKLGAAVNIQYVTFSSQANKVDNWNSGNGITAQGGTYLESGVEMGLSLLNAASSSARKVLIVVADGDSNDGYTPEGLATFKQGNNNYVYCVGLAFSNEDYWKMATGNGEDSNYWSYVSSGINMTTFFRTITDSITGLIYDPMGSDVKVLDPDSVTVQIGQTADNTYLKKEDSLLQWTPSSNTIGSDTTVTMDYSVTVKNVTVGDHTNVPLNDNAVLQYALTSAPNNPKTEEFPVPVGSYKAASLEVVYQLEGGTALALPAEYEDYNNGAANLIVTDFGNPDFRYDARYEYASLPYSDSQQYTKISSKLYSGDTEVNLNGQTIAEYIEEHTENATVAYKVVNTYKLENVPAAYSVEYYYENASGDYVNGNAPAGAPTGGSAAIGTTVSVSAADNVNAADNQFAKNVTVDNVKYAYDAVYSGNVLSDTIEATAANNVLKVHYALDANDTNVPDKYEMTVKYESADADAGTVTGDQEILTIYDEAGNWAKSGKVTASGSTANAKTGYFFSKWTKQVNESAAVDTEFGETIDEFTLTNVSAGDIHTYRAYFTKEVPSLDVTKTVTSIAGKEYSSSVKANVGEKIVWTITVKNTGNIDLNDIQVTDSITDVVWGDWNAPSGVTVTDNKISTLAPNQSASVTVSYTVAENDAANGKVANTATATSGEIRDTGDSPDVDVTARHKLIVEYYYDSVDAGNKVDGQGGTYTLNEGDNWAVEVTDCNNPDAPNHIAPASLTKDNQKYIFDKVETVDALNGTIGTSDVTVKLVYSKDEIGGGSNLDDPDGIPDKYQVVVNYVSASAETGSVSPTKEVLTIYAADGTTWAKTGDVEANGSTATAKTGYFFSKWEMTGKPFRYDKLDDIETVTTDAINLKKVTGGDEFTFTASFIKESLEVRKTVDKSSANVGDTLTYKIFVKNTGNVNLNDIEIVDTFDGAGALDTQTLRDFFNGITFVDKSENEPAKFVINSLTAGEEKEITVTYVVDKDDAGKTITNVVVSDLDESTNNDTAETTVNARVKVDYYMGDSLSIKINYTDDQSNPFNVTGAWTVAVNADATYTAPEVIKLGSVNYVYDPVATAKAWPDQTMSGDGKSNATVNLIYSMDLIGNEDKPDNVPDQYQATVIYQAAENGSITGKTKEVLTIYAADGKTWAASGTIQASGSTAKADEDHAFDYWTDNVGAEVTGEDETLAPQTISAQSGKTYTYTAYFESTYTVTYSWSGLPKVEDSVALYDASGTVVTPVEPVDETAYVDGQEYVIDTTYSSASVVYTHDSNGHVNGKYTFSGWDKTDGAIDGADVAVNGTWTYTAFAPAKLAIEKVIASIGGAAPEYGEDGKLLTNAKVGDEIVWNFKISNTGETRTQVHLKDILKIAGVETTTELDEDTIILGGGTSFTLANAFSYTVQIGDAGDVIANTVIATDDNGSETPGQSPTIKVDPSLTIDKTVSKSTVTVGDKITYTIKVTNNTNTELKNIVVKDTMLGLEQTIDTLAAGASKDIIKDYTVTTQNIGTLKNTATATDEANNTYQDSVETTVNKKPSKPSTDIPDKVPLETEDHYAYIIGYPDGNVKPAGNITRAEVATIFFRLLTDEARDLFWSTTNEYSDVAADQWFNNAISTLSNAGIINGYEDGSFRPNNPITRAEFSKIAVSFFSYVDEEYQGLFPDVTADKWYALYVEAAKELGLINGYEDGTFRPEQNITRAEACTIVNNTIQRNPHEDQLHEDMIVWPDNPAPGEVGHMWYYEEIQEATNSHDYTFANDYEDWTEILENRDWAALEKAWADSNDAPGGDVMK